MCAIQEIISLWVEPEGEVSFGGPDILEWDNFCIFDVASFELLEGDLVVQFEEVLYNWLGPQLWHFQQFVDEHLEDHHSLFDVLVVVASELPLLCDGRHGQAWVQPLQHIFQPLEIRVSALDCLAECGSVDVVCHVGLFEHSALSFLEFCDSCLRLLSGEQNGGCLWLAFDLLQKDLVGVLVVDFLQNLWTTFDGAFVLFCLKKLLYDGVLLDGRAMLLLFFELLALLVVFLELRLEFPDCVFELGEGPILEVVSCFFGGGEVFLKLFWIVIFLDDFLEEVLLLLLLV